MTLALLGRLLRHAATIALWLAIAVSAVVLGRAFEARNQPDLGPWHRIHVTAEVQAGDLDDAATWSDYRRDEAAVFAELQAKLAHEATAGGYRFERGSRLGAHAGDIDWNRSYESVPTGPIRGGVLLLHGIFRAKEVMRPMERALRAAGYAAVSVNYPSTRRPLEAHAEQISGLLDHAEGVDTVSLVGHSMGGLVSRVALARPAAWKERIRVNRLVTIGTPNRGADLADLFGTLATFHAIAGPAGAQLAASAGSPQHSPFKKRCLAWMPLG